MNGEDRAAPAAADRLGAEALRRAIRATLMPGFSGFTVPEWLREAFDDGLLSVCVYGENVRDTAQLRELGAELRSARPDALIAIDEEGGEVTRLHYLNGSPYPGAAVLGRIDDPGYTCSVGERVGRDILAAGFNLALGPIADVNSDPRNPVIGTRSFSADPKNAARHVAAFTRGLQSSGAVACVKHFPGHGDTSSDSHLERPTVDAPLEVLERRELPPFRAAIAAGVGAVMTSHILLPQIDPSGPATFSRTVLQGLLREELGFEGVIVSDALDMQGACRGIGLPEAAVRALAAGCDLLCLGTSTGPELLHEIEERIIAAIGEGVLDEDRVLDAAERALELGARAVSGSRRYAGTDRDISPLKPAPNELARIAASFEGLEHARQWLAEHPGAAVVRVENEANMAVGRAPWGPFAAAAEPLPQTEAVAASFAARPSFELAEGGAPILAENLRNGAVVIARELHLQPFARGAVDSLRASKAPLLVIEMGWPSAEGGYADLSCYGSSRLVGAALLQLFEGGRE